MNVRLDQAWWLLLALAAVPLAMLGARWMSGMARVRRSSAVVLRIWLMLLLATLLAGLTLIRKSDRIAVVAIVDSSGSVEQFVKPSPRADGTPETLAGVIERHISEWSTDRRPTDLLGVLYVDAKPRGVMALAPTSAMELPPVVPASQDATDLERAIRLASSMIPPDASGRIVLFSDGNQTTGDALRAARELTAVRPGRGGSGGGVPIDVVPLNYSVERETYIDSVDAPPTAPARSTIALRVSMVSTAPVEGWLRVSENDQVVDINGPEEGLSRRVRVSAGRHVEVVNVELSGSRTHRFNVFWEPDAPDAGGVAPDAIALNNTGSAFTVTPGKGDVLIIDGVSDARPDGPGSTLATMLRATGMSVQVASPEQARPDLLWLQEFDLVVLQNVAADTLLPGVQAALATYVSDLGGGVILTGGTQAFGAGGWKGTPLEPILPVLLDLPEKLVTPATAIILVIDNSGSMNRPVLGSDRSQQDIANEGAALAVESLDKSDMLGVIVFNSGFDVLIPLQRNLDAKKNASLVRSIAADGGTNLPPALAEAHRQLAAATAEAKHVIVLSDGVSMNKHAIPPIVKAMAKDNISVTSIAVGDSADASLMAEMARDGGGAFYRVVDPALLPRVFVKAVRLVRTPMFREQAFDPVRLPSGSPVLDGLPSLPELFGVTLTQSRQDARVSNILATPMGEPLLSTWSVGLGRVGAFTSDVHNWGRSWERSGVASRFWTQFARSMARPPSNRTQSLAASIESDRLRLRLEVTSDAGAPLDDVLVPAKVHSPGGSITQLSLAQTGPGEYEADADALATGTYVVTMSPRAGNKVLPPVVGGVVKPAGQEFRSLRSNPKFLAQLAETAGGRLIELGAPAPPSPGGMFDRTGLRPAEARLSMWRWLMIASIGALVLDVATRRVAWDRLITREFGSESARAERARTRDRSTQAASTLGRLRDAGESRVGGDSAPIPQTLSEADAEALVRAQAERRARARPSPSFGTGTTHPAVSAPVKDQQTPESGTEHLPPEEGLLAAKRRARKKFDE